MLWKTFLAVLFCLIIMEFSESSFSGKVIVITGASSGIGASLAKFVAKRGAKVVLAARRLDALQAVAAECGNESNCLVQECDVTKRGDHERVLAAALSKFGKVNCWVNNAGLGSAKPVLEVTEEDVDVMINVNTKSVLFGMQTSIKYFKENCIDEDGVVINVSSILGRLPSASIRAMYSASKAAVNSLTTNARVDLQNEGYKRIHVCLFSPGPVDTEFSRNAVGGTVDTRPRALNRQTAEEVAELMGRMILDPENNVDRYSVDAYQQAVVNYLSAPNVKSVERLAPFASVAYLESQN